MKKIILFSIFCFSILLSHPAVYGYDYQTSCKTPKKSSFLMDAFKVFSKYSYGIAGAMIVLYFINKSEIAKKQKVLHAQQQLLKELALKISQKNSENIVIPE